MYTCPTCLSIVRDAKPNPTVGFLVNMFLKNHPDKAKSKEEMKEIRKQYRPGERVLEPIRSSEISGTSEASTAVNFRDNGILGPDTAVSQESQTWTSQSATTNVNVPDYTTDNQGITTVEEASTPHHVITNVSASSWEETAKSLSNPDNVIF
jgi:hypothetical protein